MSDIKVSEMAEATEINDNDLLMMVQNDVSKKVKAGLLDWQTIWTGTATATDLITTNTNLTNIKAIRFLDDKTKCWHEVDIDDFKNGSTMRWNNAIINKNDNVMQQYDFAIHINDLANGKIDVDNASYAYQYFADTTITLHSQQAGQITKIQVKY